MSNKKKILFISYDGMTDPLGQSQVIPYLQGLSRKGYSFVLLTFEKKAALKKNREVVLELLKGYDIEWIPKKYTKNPPILSTVLDTFKIKAAAKKIFKKYKIDMVHTRPGVPALIGLWMKKKLGVKFLNDIREFYADSRVDGAMWNLSSVIYKRVYDFFKGKEEEEIRQSDGIVYLTYKAKEIISKLDEFKRGTPVKVIPCSVDLDLFDPEILDKEKVKDVKAKLGIEDQDIIISYLGSIGGWYMTNEMMKCCAVISDKMSNVKFLFISPHRHEVIQEAAKKYGLPVDKIIVQHASRKEVPLLLSLSKFSIFFIKPCFSKLSSSPTKHGEIMAMNIPVITNSGVGDMKEIVNKYNSGIVVDTFGGEDFKNIAAYVLQNASSEKLHIREAAFEYYSLEKAVESYAQLYAEILN